MVDLEVDDVFKSYGSVEILHGINFAVPKGTFVVIVGPSGCGKTTLLRSLAGLEGIDRGNLRIAGKDVTDLEPRERDIAMVFQNYALYPTKNVFENMAYGLRIRRVPKNEIRQRIEAAAERLQIDHLLQRRPAQLSGGQRQRVAMGRAMVRNPGLFLFDEPLSNLDAALRNELRVEIKRIQRSLGVTAVYVTHDQHEAMTLADVLIVMRGGKIEQLGNPRDIYGAPATRFVAGFLGSPTMSFVPARVEGDYLKLQGGPAFELDQLPVVKTALPNEIDVGFRSEDVELLFDTAPGTVPGTVELVEELGAFKHIHLTTPMGVFVVNHSSGQDLPTGTAHLKMDPRRLKLFDRSSGVRLDHMNLEEDSKVLASAVRSMR